MKIKLIMAIIYGIMAGLLSFIAAGCIDGTENLTISTAKLLAAGAVFGILAVMELVKLERLAKEN